MSCQPSKPKNTSLTVHLKGYSDTTGVYLDVLRKDYVPFDTARYVDGERFDFQRELTSPDFFRLRLANGQEMPLILYPGEYSVLIVDANQFNDSPSITGNPDTQVLWDAALISADFGKQLSALQRHFNDSVYAKPDAILKDSFVRFVDTLLQRKRDEFLPLMSQYQSRLAALPLLMQCWGNLSFFTPDSNRTQFVQVDTAMMRHYGQVEGVKTFHYHLDSVLAAIDSVPNTKLGDVLADPRIQNVWGEYVPFLKYRSKPLLIVVWSSSSSESDMAITQVKGIYETWHKKGLELYMISVDSIKAQWEKSVNHYRLPCTQVCDFKGSQSPVWKKLNLQTVPACFLLNRTGVVVAKNEWGSELEKAVIKQLETK
jgi:peroxiredoxin